MDRSKNMYSAEGLHSYGRPKGSLNKTTKEIREKFQQILDGISTEDMIKDLKALKPSERLNTIIALTEYIAPKLARTQMSHEAPDVIEGFTINVKRNRDGPTV